MSRVVLCLRCLRFDEVDLVCDIEVADRDDGRVLHRFVEPFVDVLQWVTNVLDLKQYRIVRHHEEGPQSLAALLRSANRLGTRDSFPLTDTAGMEQSRQYDARRHSSLKICPEGSDVLR